MELNGQHINVVSEYAMNEARAMQFQMVLEALTSGNDFALYCREDEQWVHIDPTTMTMIYSSGETIVYKGHEEFQYGIRTALYCYEVFVPMQKKIENKTLKLLS